MPLLPVGRCCPLQTILSDLVRCEDSNGRFTHHYCQQRAVTTDPESSNSNRKGAKLPLLSAEGCHTWLEGQHCPLITNQGVFFQGGEPSADINSRLFLMNKKGLNIKYTCSLNPAGNILMLCRRAASRPESQMGLSPSLYLFSRPRYIILCQKGRIGSFSWCFSSSNPTPPKNFCTWYFACAKSTRKNIFTRYLSCCTITDYTHSTHIVAMTTF